MFWQNLENKVIGIWGMGKEGLAVHKTLGDRLHQTTIKLINEDNLADINNCDIVIKSPGVSIYRQEIVQAKEKGIKFTSSSNLFLSNRRKETKVVAITGTKGKSTTSSLLAHTLQHLRIKADLGGNIGKPLVELCDSDAEWVVAEMSSYQCADLQGAADIGILLNLYPEHLQWHGSHQRYYADKLNMIKQANIKIINKIDARSSELAHFTDAVYFNDEKAVHIKNGFFYDGTTRLFACENLPLLGAHNMQNACAVLSAVKIIGGNLSECAEAFASFKGLEHRLEIIGEYNGLTFVDDSISTTPETAIAALKALDKGQNLTLLAGGFDRGQDYAELIDYVSKIKDRCKIITLPDTGERIAQAAQGKITIKRAQNIKQAVELAFEITPNKGTVILSPAAPSYNCYKNFAERGEDFANCIKSLAK